MRVIGFWITVIISGGKAPPSHGDLFHSDAPPSLTNMT